MTTAGHIDAGRITDEAGRRAVALLAATYEKEKQMDRGTALAISGRTSRPA
jgi:hypothetical protein